MFDEEMPRKRKDHLIGQKLDELSVADIDAVVLELQAEIKRLEEARQQKTAHLGAAEALFGKR